MKKLAGLFAIPLLVACAAGTSGSPSPDDPRFTIELPSLDAAPSSGEGITGEVPEDLLNEIVATAAREAGVDAADVQVLVAEEVIWSDGSLGCPELDMVYTQALVPGYRVVVDAGGQTLNFHAAQAGQLLMCENPKPPSGTGG